MPQKRETINRAFGGTFHESFDFEMFLRPGG